MSIMPFLLAQDVRNVGDSFYDLLVDSPGTKEDKQTFFSRQNLYIPRTNYDIMWDSLVERYGRAIAGEAIFDYVLYSANRRLQDLINTSKDGYAVEITDRDLNLVHDLFHNNGNPRRVAELLFEYMDEIDFKWEKKEPKKMAIRKSDNMGEDRPEFEYDVALSFAGPDRKYVEDVAKNLAKKGIEVFYDKFERTTLWGKDLYVHLDEVYRKKARYCVMFISKHYAKRLWTTHERESAQARAFEEHKEYILPVRFDDSEIPGIRPTVGYVDAQKVSPKELADMINKKLK